MHKNLGEWNETLNEEEENSINKCITEKPKGKKTKIEKCTILMVKYGD